MKVMIAAVVDGQRQLNNRIALLFYLTSKARASINNLARIVTLPQV